MCRLEQRHRESPQGAHRKTTAWLVTDKHSPPRTIDYNPGAKWVKCAALSSAERSTGVPQRATPPRNRTGPPGRHRAARREKDDRALLAERGQCRSVRHLGARHDAASTPPPGRSCGRAAEHVAPSPIVVGPETALPNDAGRCAKTSRGRSFGFHPSRFPSPGDLIGRWPMGHNACGSSVSCAFRAARCWSPCPLTNSYGSRPQG